MLRKMFTKQGIQKQKKQRMHLGENTQVFPVKSKKLFFFMRYSKREQLQLLEDTDLAFVFASSYFFELIWSFEEDSHE